MESLNSALLVVHIFAGTIAVIFGLTALLTFKPLKLNEGRFHRSSGNLFIISMIVVIGTATGLTMISFNPYFAGLTATAAIVTFSGYRILGRKRPDINAAHQARTLDWAVTFIVLGVGLLLLVLAVSGQVTKNLPVVYSLSIGSIVYAVYDFYRFVRPLDFPFSPNLWLYEHIVKMVGGYFAAVAAFSGSVLVLLPPPWRQLWATVLGQILVVILVLYYRRKLNAERSGKRIENASVLQEIKNVV